jgi:hypothetical protein
MFVMASPHAPRAHFTADLDTSFQVVTVPVHRAAAVLDALVADVGDGPIALGDSGQLWLDSGFEPVGREIERWAASGRLIRAGRLPGRRTRVTVELGLWSADFGELSVRPRARRAHRWGRRRLLRHLELARVATDELHARLREISNDIVSTSTAGSGPARSVEVARHNADQNVANLGVAA